MKLKPTSKTGGLVAELEPQETQFPTVAFEPLPVFQLKRILVPVDFSDCSKKALHYAIPFARQFKAEIMLLHVVSPYPPTPEMPVVDAEAVQQAKDELDKLRRSIGDDVPSNLLVRVGTPHTEIFKVAQELGMNLIILSTHGRTGMARVFLGSTAERVVRQASCPVLVVRESERDFVLPEPPSKEQAGRA